MSIELRTTYDPKEIEDKTYSRWMDSGYFHAEPDKEKQPYNHCDPPAEHHGAAAYGARAG